MKKILLFSLTIGLFSAGMIGIATDCIPESAIMILFGIGINTLV